MDAYEDGGSSGKRGMCIAMTILRLPTWPQRLTFLGLFVLVCVRIATPSHCPRFVAGGPCRCFFWLLVLRSEAAGERSGLVTPCGEGCLRWASSA